MAACMSDLLQLCLNAIKNIQLSSLAVRGHAAHLYGTRSKIIVYVIHT